MCRELSIDVKGLTPSDFKFFSQISVFENQADYIPSITELLGRFSGRDAEAYVHMAGARCDGRAAGIIVVTPTYETAELKSDGSRLCWVDTLAVDKEFQRRGVGKKLLEHTVTELQGSYDGLCLTVNVRNESAKAMYLKFGFKDSSEVYLGGFAGPQHILILPLPFALPASI